MFRLNKNHILLLKVFLHCAAFLPLARLYYCAFADKLGADPVQVILHFTGIGAFNLLLLSLLVSPVAKKLKQGQLINIRRPLGLYAFTYALFHFLSYIAFDLLFEWQLLISEIFKRPYIYVGFISLLILTVLALTSTKSIQRKLGSTWQKIHNWVYLALLTVSLHYFWSVKSGLIQPIMYICFALLLTFVRYKKLTKNLKRQNQRI
ncbi:protein-methionine-sulfoxide reductase heme-binding subunit MsrQ [uncultured Paraglaciecola sp.]|uniref:protein-methionine-sulfoxide reductase heme-binding subunit MsrQ n=1 Tax=uncultured Paraglaciecola sp. TaxID=1765024 RepID=UPI0025979368|nr:protein-methionine-sulfoxide reductase heme-binding subunit MsrQ [uncultured Paraglaciecola sp.]